MNKDTRLIKIEDPQAISEAIEIIQSGGMIVFPTDTVYGVGVSAFNESAIDKIYQVKERSKNKAIPILVGDPAQLSKITPPPGDQVKSIMDKFWPGALTLILQMLSDLPDNLSSTGTIGVRIPNYKFAQDLLLQTGPLAVTSANLSGESSAKTAEEVFGNIGGKIDLILDGGKSTGGIASTVLDCTKPEPVILRSGPISLDDIKSVLAQHR